MHHTCELGRGGLEFFIGTLALGCVPANDLAGFSDQAGAGQGGGSSGAAAFGSFGGGAMSVAPSVDSGTAIGGSSALPDAAAVGVAAGGSSAVVAANGGGGASVSATPDADADADVPVAAFCASGGQLGPDEQTCYYMSPAVLGWIAASDSCRANGRALLKIDSVEEDTFISGLSRANLWIGASDLLLDGSFVWTDGSPIVFSNWGSAQPDDYPGPDCVEKRQEVGAHWYDQPCGDAKLYVCEAPAQR